MPLLIIGLTGIAGIVYLSSRPAYGVFLVFNGFKSLEGDRTQYGRFELINRTTNAIKYLVVRDSPIALLGTFSRERTKDGWAPVQGESYALECVDRELTAGQRVELLVPLDPKAPPKLFAACCQGVRIPRSPTALWLRRLVTPLCRIVKIPLIHPDALPIYDQQIWCPTPLSSPKTSPPNQSRQPKPDERRVAFGTSLARLG